MRSTLENTPRPVHDTQFHDRDCGGSGAARRSRSLEGGGGGEGLTIPCLAVIGAHWLVFRGHRRLAAFGFWFLAISINGLYAACLYAAFFGVALNDLVLAILFVAWMVIFLPTIVSVGTAWIILSTHDGAIPRRSGPAAGVFVFALAALPVFTLVLVAARHGIP
jgi:hypothetical protein